MDDYRQPRRPRRMPDLCEFCSKQDVCKTYGKYKCELFQIVFIQSWDETVAYLREKLGVNKEVI